MQAFASAWQASASARPDGRRRQGLVRRARRRRERPDLEHRRRRRAPAAHALPGMAAVQRGYARGAGRHAVLHRLRLRARQAGAVEDGRHAGGNVEAAWASGASRAPRFASAGSLLFFRANSDELWRSDGTVAGTVMLTDSGDPDEFAARRRSPVLRGVGFRPRPRAVAFRRDAARHLAREGHRSGSRGRHARTADERRRHPVLLGGRRHHGLRAVEERRHRPTAPSWCATSIPPTSPCRRTSRRSAACSTSPHRPRASATSCGAATARPEGTVLVRDINLTRSSYPESPANVGGVLFFNADDGRLGEELWAVPAASTTTTSTVSTTTATSSTTTSLAHPADDHHLERRPHDGSRHDLDLDDHQPVVDDQLVHAAGRDVRQLHRRRPRRADRSGRPRLLRHDGDDAARARAGGVASRRTHAERQLARHGPGRPARRYARRRPPAPERRRIIVLRAHPGCEPARTQARAALQGSTPAHRERGRRDAAASRCGKQRRRLADGRGTVRAPRLRLGPDLAPDRLRVARAGRRTLRVRGGDGTGGRTRQG